MHKPSATPHYFLYVTRVAIPILLFGIVALYVMLVIEPFFQHNLHLQADRVARGAADPRSFAPFAWTGRGNTLYTLALVLAWGSPILLAGFLGTFWLLTMEAWPPVATRVRPVVYSILMLGLGALLFMCTIGTGIAFWLLD